MSLDLDGLTALSRNLATSSPELGLDGVRSRSQRRSQGAFFTPLPLVEFVVEQALDAWFSTSSWQWHPAGYPEIRILDPSAGDGRFLRYAAQSLVRRALDRGCIIEEQKQELEAALWRHCLIAIERDPEYARHMSAELGAMEVHCTEALLSGVLQDESVDVVVGNPPYLRSVHLGAADSELRARLRGHYTATSYREWDLYAAFLEQGLRWLNQDGHLAFVLPSRWWSAEWATPLRAQLCEQGALCALVDFGETQLFPGAVVYSSLCLASKVPSRSIQVARFRNTKWVVQTLESCQLGEPWNLSVGPQRALFQRLQKEAPSLGEVARIAKGAGTNADSVFVIPDASRNLEAAVLRPLLRGRDIQAFGTAGTWPQILVPYHRDGTFIEAKEMKRRFPNAYSYLCEHRERLEKRERGRFAGPHFYCFGRPQNMEFLGLAAPKIVVPDVTKEGRALLDRNASMVLDSAYALRLREGNAYDLPALCGILNSRLVRLWLTERGLPLRGGYTRMKTAYLKGLPLPPVGASLGVVSELVCQGASQEDIDEQVRLAYQVEREYWYL